MADKKQRIRRFLLDLTSLEINTIVTENITGEAMGDPRQAIESIRTLYASKLDEVAGVHGVESAMESVPVRTHDLSFDDQKAMADKLMRQHAPNMSPEDQGYLSRIQGHCEELDKLWHKLIGTSGTGTAEPGMESVSVDSSRPSASSKAPQIGPEDMMALRKIWELGAEPIAVQTVIQAGGDMITRIHPDYATGKHSLLLDLHQTGVSTAIGIWQTLVDTATQLLERLIDR